jgi:hypothetical protein
MCDDARMMDFPMAELLDESLCMIWLARHPHPQGLIGPRCGPRDRRLFRAQGHVPAYRWRTCDGDDILLTGTVFENTRQRPATLVLLRRGMAQGAPTARLAREWGLSRTPLHTLRPRVHAHLNATAPTGVRTGPVLEADARYQHAGERKPAPS